MGSSKGTVEAEAGRCWRQHMGQAGHAQEAQQVRLMRCGVHMLTRPAAKSMITCVCHPGLCCVCLWCVSWLGPCTGSVCWINVELSAWRLYSRRSAFVLKWSLLLI